MKVTSGTSLSERNVSVDEGEKGGGFVYFILAVYVMDMSCV